MKQSAKNETRRPALPAACILLLCLPVCGQSSYTIQEEILYPTAAIRVQTVAESTDVIKNPAQNTQIEYIVPEGVRVEKGDLIAKFDMTLSLEELRKAQNSTESRRLSYSNELARMNENLLSLENSLAEVKDELKVLKAQLDYQKSLPLKDTLTISKGRREVARKNAEAEEKELERARERHRLNMISSRALQKAERASARTQALLKHAENEHLLAGLPAGANTIRILELKIENAALKQSKLEEELSKRANIAEINRQASKKETELRQQQVDELAEDTSKTNLFAKEAGTVLYTGRFKRHLLGGGTPRKNEGLLEFPDLNSLILQSSIRDEQRGFFDVGDQAVVHLHTHRETAFEGRIKSISPLPRDLTEASSKLWGEEEKESGIKVYDVLIEFTSDEPPAVPLGIYGTATLKTRKPLVAPVVPLSFVKTTDEGFFLSAKGRYQAVEGRVMQGQLVLDDESWLGVEIGSEGRFESEDQQNLPIRTDRLVSSGELTPVNSEMIRVSRIRFWGLKIQSLISENSYVRKGDELAVLESDRMNKQLKEQEAQLTSARSARKSSEETQAIQKRNREFGLKRETNLLEIKNLEQDIVTDGKDYAALHKAELELEQAAIEHVYLEEELAWAEERSGNFAAAELERMRRDVRRQTLKEELGRIRVEKEAHGSTPLQRAKAAHDVAVQKAKVDEMTQDLGVSSFGAKRQLRQDRSREKKLEAQLHKTRDSFEKLIIQSTATGLVKYERIWDGMGISKVKVGLSIWPGVHLMSVANTDRMFVRIPVPEHYFSRVQIEMPVDVIIPSVSQEKFSGRITNIEFMLTPREQGNTDIGLYGSHEPTGSQVFYAQVTLDKLAKADLKAGATAHVIFPFPK